MAAAAAAAAAGEAGAFSFGSHLRPSPLTVLLAPPNAASSASMQETDSDGEKWALLLAVAANAKAVAGNRKLAITQTVKFAGKTIQVTKLVTAGTEAARRAQGDAAAAAARAVLAQATAGGAPGGAAGAPGGAAGAPGGAAGAPGGAAGAPGGTEGVAAAGAMSLRSVVANLDKPETISTLAKTSLDWDQYKNQQGLDDELERAAQAGFVERQSFLQRVDERSYERERAQRAVERARGEPAQKR
jgi:hypothetical protein